MQKGIQLILTSSDSYLVFTEPQGHTLLVFVYQSRGLIYQPCVFIILCNGGKTGYKEL